MSKLSEDTVNLLYEKYLQAMDIADCYVDVTGITASKGKHDSKLVLCQDGSPSLRLKAFCVTASNAKDIETALDVLFGNSLTSKNIANLVRLNESKKIYLTKLDPAFDPTTRTIMSHSKLSTLPFAKQASSVSPTSKETSALSLLTTPYQCKSLDEMPTKSFASFAKRRDALAAVKEDRSELFTLRSPLADISSLKSIMGTSSTVDPITSPVVDTITDGSLFRPLLSSTILSSPTVTRTTMPLSTVPLSQSMSSPQLGSGKIAEMKNQLHLRLLELKERMVHLSELKSKEMLKPFGGVSQASANAERTVAGDIVTTEQALVKLAARESLSIAEDETEKLEKDLQTADVIRRYSGGQPSAILSPNLSVVSDPIAPIASSPDLLKSALATSLSSSFATPTPSLAAFSHPLFDLNRTAYTDQERMRVRTGMKPEKSIGNKEYQSIVASKVLQRRVPSHTERIDINDKWRMIVEKYSLGQTLGPLLNDSQVYLLNRTVFNHSYEIRSSYQGDDSDDSDTEEETSEEGKAEESLEEEEYAPDVLESSRKRSKVSAPKANKKYKRRGKSQQKNIAEAEKTVQQIEEQDKDLLAHVTARHTSTSLRDLLTNYDANKRSASLSDADLFMQSLSMLATSTKRDVFLYLGGASSDLRQGVTTKTKSTLSKYAHTYWVENIRIASNNPDIYRTAIDFMVITGVLSDYDAFRAIITFDKAFQKKSKVFMLKADSTLLENLGEVDPYILLGKLLETMPNDNLLNVSDANSTFTAGISYWPIAVLSSNNVHYLPGIPLCSNNISTYRMAMYHMYSKQYVATHAASLLALETAIKGRTSRALVN